MRKKEQSQRQITRVNNIANIVEDVLTRDKAGDKYYKKIKERVDKALKKISKEVGDSLAESISMYYEAEVEEEE